MKKNVRKEGKIRMFKLSNILVFGFLMYFVYTFAEQQISLNKYNSQIESYESQIEAKKDDLKLYVSSGSDETNDEYIEKVARETLGLVKPYERIYIDVSK